MKTRIDIDDQLMASAQDLTNFKSELVNMALQLYVTVESQKRLEELWGKIEIDEKAYE